PFFDKTEQEAIDLIETYIDDLPDWSFSDRLTSGSRADVRRVVKNTVRQAYHGNTGQPDPITSSDKLKTTAQAWKRKGFNPSDKTTWNKATANATISLAEDFTFSPQEIQRLTQLLPLLNTDLPTTANVVRYVLRLVKGHQGELAITLVK